MHAISSKERTSTVPETSYPSIFVCIHSFWTKGRVAWIITPERKFVKICQIRFKVIFSPRQYVLKYIV